jgi:hypothetical protein
VSALPSFARLDDCIVDATLPIRTPRPPDVVNQDYEIRLVRTVEQLAQVCEVRQQAYSRRLPDMAALFDEPEPQDFAAGSVVFMAVRKSDGKSIGTARLQTNAAAPLEFETHIDLPDKFTGKLLAQGMRLAVVAGNDTLAVTRLLLKAMYLYCRGAQVSDVIVAAEPPRDRFYRAFGFRDIFPGKRFVIASAAGHECRMLYFDLDRTEEMMHENRQNLGFLRAYCPDIHVFSSVAGVWLHPRRS